MQPRTAGLFVFLVALNLFRFPAQMGRLRWRREDLRSRFADSYDVNRLFRVTTDTYLRRRINPVIARVTPSNRCQEGASWKNKIPATAMMAAPPARIAGTAESGPPFWKRRKNAIVPAPTHTPVSTE